MEVVDVPNDASVKSEGDDSSVFSDPQPMFSFELRGRPIPWKGPKVNRHGVKYNPQSKLLTRLKETLSNQMTVAPLTGPILMEIDFFFRRPKKHFHRDESGNLVRRLDRPRNCTLSRDIANLAKLVLDALNGVAYVDERQVVQLGLRKRYSDVKYYYDDNARIEEHTSIRIITL